MVGLTDSSATLTDTYAYNAFGGVRERTGTSTQPYQYVGNAYDADAKLWDFHARAYDAGVGRFTSKDPVAGLATMPQTLNPYAYGVNGPLAYPDPSGEFPPALLAAAPIAGRVALAIGADYAMNAAVSATHYMLTRPQDKPFGFEDFAYTVGGEALDITIADLKNPLTLLSPAHKFDKFADVMRLARGGGRAIDDVGRNFPRPPVRDITTEAGKRLDRAIDELFRTKDRYPGGTAEAIRRQGDHIQKGKDRVRQLEKLIDSGRLSAADELTARQVRNDLRDALKSPGQ